MDYDILIMKNDDSKTLSFLTQIAKKFLNGKDIDIINLYKNNNILIKFIYNDDKPRNILEFDFLNDIDTYISNLKYTIVILNLAYSAAISRKFDYKTNYYIWNDNKDEIMEDIKLFFILHNMKK